MPVVFPRQSKPQAGVDANGCWCSGGFASCAQPVCSTPQGWYLGWFYIAPIISIIVLLFVAIGLRICHRRSHRRQLDLEEDVQPGDPTWFSAKKSWLDGPDQLLEAWKDRSKVPPMEPPSEELPRLYSTDFFPSTIDSWRQEVRDVEMSVEDWKLIYGTSNVFVYRGNSVHFSNNNGWMDQSAVCGQGVNRFPGQVAYFEVLISIRGRNKTVQELVLQDSINTAMEEENAWRQEVARYEEGLRRGHTDIVQDDGIPAWMTKESLRDLSEQESSPLPTESLSPVESPSTTPQVDQTTILPTQPVSQQAVLQWGGPTLPTVYQSRFARFGVTQTFDCTPTITVGFVTRPYPGFYLPGRHANSVALVVSKTGELWVTFATETNQGQWNLHVTVGEGDVVGVGWSKLHQGVFFTLNGNLLRIPSEQSKQRTRIYTMLHPTRNRAPVAKDVMEMTNPNDAYIIPMDLIPKGQTLYPAVGSRGPATLLTNVNGPFHASFLDEPIDVSMAGTLFSPETSEPCPEYPPELEASLPPIYRED